MRYLLFIGVFILEPVPIVRCKGIEEKNRISPQSLVLHRIDLSRSLRDQGSNIDCSSE
jgi:hypothetical protein